MLAVNFITVCGITAIFSHGGGHGFPCCICYHVGFEISCWIPHLYSCMSLMMTNVALSLQWCVPHIRGGLLLCGVGHGENMMGLRIWKWEMEVRNGKSERGCEEDDRREINRLRCKEKSRYSIEQENLTMGFILFQSETKTKNRGNTVD